MRVASEGKAPRPPREATVAEDESPGVPGFRRWNTVYLFVFVVFVLTVVALTVFSSLLA